ncbi:hypothetical protein [Parasynechococcus sp.]|uniref:hypothetical protein n=1 Tax=Parasynechococcus sp. TaxID=3101203 RepID=UPI00370465F7
MGFMNGQEASVRYRGFLLMTQTNRSWLVRPERRPTCSLADVKGLLDWRLAQEESEIGVA